MSEKKIWFMFNQIKSKFKKKIKKNKTEKKRVGSVLILLIIILI